MSGDQPMEPAKRAKRTTGSDADSRKKFLLAHLQVDPIHPGTSGYFSFQGKFRLLLTGEEWTRFGKNPQNIALYILEALYDPKHNISEIPEMQLVREQLGKHDSLIVEQFFNCGPTLIATSTCESEIAFPCQARTVKCPGNAYCMLGPIFEHVQYFTSTETPKGLFEEQVLEFEHHVCDGRKFKTRDYIQYKTQLKSVTAISWKAHHWAQGNDPEKLHSMLVETGDFGFTTHTPVLVFSGMGFRDNQGRMGLMIGLGRLFPEAREDDGKMEWIYGATGFHALVSHEIMCSLVPNGLSEMDTAHVLQTDMRLLDEYVAFRDMTQLFYVEPLAAQSSSNSSSSAKVVIGSKFIVGHLNVEYEDYLAAAHHASKYGKNVSVPKPISKPVELFGVRALPGNHVFEALAQSSIYFNGFAVNSKLTLLRACFEDGLQYMAAAKPEECRTSRNTFVIQHVPVRDVIGLVYALTDEAKREASFKSNTITVTFGSTLLAAGAEPGPEVEREDYDRWVSSTWDTTVGLWGRNAHRTPMPGLGGNLLSIGQLRMQFVLLPREFTVVKVAYSQLSTPGGTIPCWTNFASSESKAEFNRTFRAAKHCKHCLRRVSRVSSMNGCYCELFEDGN